MSSSSTSSRVYTISDLKYFLYTCTINENFNPIKSNARTVIECLIRDGKGDEIIKEIVQYSTMNSSLNSTNIDATAFVLAVCVTLRHSEHLTHSAYNAFKDISETPLHLFAFISYHKYLLDELKREKVESRVLTEEEAKKQFGRGWGKGQRKAVIKWYNEHSEEDILRLVTKYRRSHSWSHKDVIKMGRIKAGSNGIALIFKYLMFGFNKIQNEKVAENEKYLFEFISDYENLKHASTGADAAVLIRKHKFHLEHLPTKTQKYKEIWEALVEDMSVQQFCTYLCVLASKGLLKPDTATYKHVVEKILTREQATLSKIHPIYPSLALQCYSDFSKRVEAADSPGEDLIPSALFNVFQTSASIQDYSSNKRILVITEVNAFMLNSPTDGLRVLNAIDTAAAILLTLLYTEKSCDFLAINDKINQVNFPPRDQNPDLSAITAALKQFQPFDPSSNESVFSWCSANNNKQYDFFIYLLATKSDESKLLRAIEAYRTQANVPRAKLILINLTGKISTFTVDNLNLNFKGWNLDSYSVLQSYLSDKF